MRHWRRNADDSFRAAERRLSQEGTQEAFDNLIRVAIRTNSIMRLSAPVLLQAIARDPFLLSELPEGVTSGLVNAMHVRFITTPGNWFPEHRLEYTCPRGHRLGERRTLESGVTTRTRFALMETGAVTYRDVVTARHGYIQVNLGDWDQGDSVDLFMVCDVCEAVWQPDWNVVEVEYL